MAFFSVNIAVRNYCFICSSSNQLILLNSSYLKSENKITALIEEIYGINLNASSCEYGTLCQQCLQLLRNLKTLVQEINLQLRQLSIPDGVLSTSDTALTCSYCLPSFTISKQTENLPAKISAPCLSQEIVSTCVSELPKKKISVISLKYRSRSTDASAENKVQAENILEENFKRSIEIHEDDCFTTSNICETGGLYVSQYLTHLEDQYNCYACESTFSTKASLEEHIGTCESATIDSNDVHCKFCDKKFSSFEIDLHLKRVHGQKESAPAGRFYNINYKSERCKKGSQKSSALLSCNICNKRFKFKRSVERHMAVHSRALHSCKRCGIQYVTECALKNHIKRCERSSKCPTCGVVFADFKSLRSHEKIVHSTRKFQCVACGKVFKSFSNLNKHENVHKDIRPFPCSFCEQAFKAKRSRDNHEIAVHTHAKAYQCSCCGKCCTTKPQLKDHELIHTGEKPHQCSFCPKKFRTSTLLLTHKRIHTGERPHTCSVCHMSFASRTTLKGHFYRHTGQKPYKCSFCDSWFRQSSSRKSHEKQVHHKKLAAQVDCVDADVLGRGVGTSDETSLDLQKQVISGNPVMLSNQDFSVQIYEVIDEQMTDN